MLRSFLYSAGGSSPVTANLTASRTSGPAPLAVFFDASGSTHTDGGVDMFNDPGYSFNHGDSGAGNYATGYDKNVNRGGPLSAHVYETPGTYTAKVRVRDAAGNISQDEVTITVLSADDYYSGENTVCISKTSNHSGAPSGALLMSNQTSFPAYSSTKRYLFHAGQDFSDFGDGNIFINQLNDVQVGRYSTGADPIFNGLYWQGTSSVYAARNTFMDLYMNDQINCYTSPQDTLLLRCRSAATDPLTACEIGAIGITPINLFIVECDINGGHNGLTALGRNIAIMGNDIDTPVEHCMRIWNGSKVFIGHNVPRSPGTIRHHIKFQASGTAAPSDNATEQSSRYVVLARNRCEGVTNSWAFASGPENNDTGESDQQCYDFIHEGNVFNGDWAVEINMGGARMTERGNINLSGTYNADTGMNPNRLLEDGPYTTGGGEVDTSDPV